MQAMDVFIFPSLFEGLPLTLVEAQAAGLPCLISDRIPADCRLTDLVRALSLETPADVWAERICGMAQCERKDTFDEICKSGFDITENAKWLQNEYVKSFADEWERTL